MGNVVQNKRFTVYFDGKLRPRFSRVKVALALKERFHFKEKLLGEFFKGKVVIKENVDRDTAINLRKSFYEIGVELEIEVENSAQAQTVNTKKAQRKAVTQPAKKKRKSVSTPSVIEQVSVNKPKPRQADIAANKINYDYLKQIFSLPIHKNNFSRDHKSSLILVATLVTLAPLIYIGFIASIIFGLNWHITNLQAFLLDISTALYLLANAVSLVIGVALIVLLLKPFFVRYKRSPSKVLDANKHKIFFDLVDLLCENMGVIPPQSIAVNNETAVSVSFKHGILGVVRNEYTLAVGMPLLTGMSAQQVVGVLAHELGHNAQSLSMRAHYIINTVNAWLHRRAYKPDGIEKTIQEWLESSAYKPVHFILYLVNKVAGLARWIIRILFHLNIALSRRLSREMEFDADRYQSSIAGSMHFKSTAICQYQLIQARVLVDRMSDSGSKGSLLFDNLPMAIAAQKQHTDKDLIEKIKQQLMKPQINVWDAHPANKLRIEKVERYKDAGIFKDSRPANLFIPHFEELCQFVTLQEYIHSGIKDAAEHVVENSEVISMLNKNKMAEESLNAYFNGVFKNDRLIDFNMQPAKNKQGMALQEAVDSLRELIPDYRDLSLKATDYARIIDIMKAGLCYVRAEIKIDQGYFHLKSTDIESVCEEIFDLEEKYNSVLEKLGKIDALISQRIRLSIDKMEGDVKVQSTHAYHFLQAISRANSEIVKLSQHHVILSELIKKRAHQRKLKTKIDNHTKICQDLGNQVLYKMKAATLIESQTRQQSMDEFIRTWFNDDFVSFSTLGTTDCVKYSNNMLNAIRYQYTKTLGDLAKNCIAIEQSAGIKPLRLIT